jgi:hypothetical protein
VLLVGAVFHKSLKIPRNWVIRDTFSLAWKFQKFEDGFCGPAICTSLSMWIPTVNWIHGKICGLFCFPRTLIWDSFDSMRKRSLLFDFLHDSDFPKFIFLQILGEST